ncbi:MAG: DNA polymerase III subunit alpha [Gemmatimonadota bacterium]
MYIELHCHSGYSFLDGASHPEELVHQAVKLGYPALALTDHDGLYGSMEFAQLARSHDLQAITGAEVTLRECGIPGDAPGDPSGTTAAPPPLPHHALPHITLLAETPAGYANLCRLLSHAHRTSPRREPALPLDRLLEHAEGLILLTGCRQSPLARHLDNAVASGEAFLRRLRSAFGPDHLFVELQENQVRGDGSRNRALGALADRMGVPVVATGNVHYHRRKRHRLQDVLTAIRHRTTLDGSHHLRRGNACFHLARREEMAWRFASRPDALASTLRIAERCAAFDLTRDLGYHFPDFQGSQRAPAPRVLAEVCRAALDEKYPASVPAAKHRDAALSRLEEELDLVERHGLSGFFLVYRDILELAREVAVRVRGGSPRAHAGLPPGRGRGSSVSSIICYLIGLSHVDPIASDLFLGRFLNEAMGSVPDIDLDFPREIREELILEVYRRYGSEHAGLVCIFPTYRLRSAVREVGKALELPQGELDKLSKLAERGSARHMKEELARLPEFREKANAKGWQQLAEVMEEIAGLPRHISQHVGGMIISSRPLTELVPLEPATMEGRVLCQWDKDSCDDAGFIKIDFLALGMLSLVEEAVDLIAVRHGEAPDLSRIDLKDEAVYSRICDGDTTGIFQVESRAQIQMLRRTRPTTLEELAVQVAIVRPGPIVGGAVNPYVRRKERLRENPDFVVPYEHPALERALGETLGVIIYQDQVLKVCRELAGFTDGQAEGLRRAMSRKRSKEVMKGYWEAFREGATAREIPEETARTVFRQVVAFSEFGFPKSHAVAFALLAYQSAWLRHYFATEYYVALFNNQPMGFYSLDALARDARRQGIHTLLPDVNASGVECTGEGSHLRVGLGFVRGWGTDIAREVVAEREQRGRFRSLPDFLRRTPGRLKRPAVENLIWVGGMDAMGMTRRELLWQTGLWLGPEEAGGIRGGRDDDAQLPLALDDSFDGLPFPDLGPEERMVAEYRLLRFSTKLHPLALLRDQLPSGTVSSGILQKLPQGSTVRLAGVVVARQRPQTAKGYLFILMEDEDGPVNVIVKPDVYERHRSSIRMEPFLAVEGKLQKDGKTLNVVATGVQALRVGGPKGAVGGPRGDPPLEVTIPTPLEYLPDRRDRKPDPFDYLTALRQAPPEVKSWG